MGDDNGDSLVVVEIIFNYTSGIIFSLVLSKISKKMVELEDL